MRYQAQNKADIDKISQSLQKMTHEDQTLKVVNDAENKQTLLYGSVIQTQQLLQEYSENLQKKLRLQR